LRATLFAETRNLETPFALAVFRAYWTDSLDISDLAVLGSLGAGVGLEAGESRRRPKTLSGNKG
jgi:predicted DsbA family dithiol-disulfide isomerase